MLSSVKTCYPTQSVLSYPKRAFQRENLLFKAKTCNPTCIQRDKRVILRDKRVIQQENQVKRVIQRENVQFQHEIIISNKKNVLSNAETFYSVRNRFIQQVIQRDKVLSFEAHLWGIRISVRLCNVSVCIFAISKCDNFG